MAYSWSTLSLEELASQLGQPGSQNSHYVEIEMLRRQTEAQVDASKAQIEAAKYSRKNARYMLWSVIAIFLVALFPYVEKFGIFLGWIPK